MKILRQNSVIGSSSSDSEAGFKHALGAFLARVQVQSFIKIRSFFESDLVHEAVGRLGARYSEREGHSI
jgi:hypothetical protein